MQVKAKVNNDTLILSVEGELDQHTASAVKNELDAHMSKVYARQVILDLSNLEFMDSTGIGVLIGRYKKMKEKNVPIFILNPSSHIDRILNMTAIYQIMPKLN